MTLPMIDEASFQTRAWTAAALRKAGIKVVAVKATEGVTYVSPQYGWQVNQALDAGCAVMHYHLARYGNSQDEAKWFFDAIHAHAGPMPGELVMLDNEAQYIEALPPSSASAWVGAWTKEVRRLTGAAAVVQYTSRDPIARGCLDSVKGKEPLFVAEPGANPAAPVAVPGWDISFLQYGTRPSAAGPTDADAAYFGSLTQVRKLGIPQAAPDPNSPVRIMIQQGDTRSLIELGGAHLRRPSDIILATAFERLTGHMLAKPPVWGGLEAAYLDAGDWSAPLPAGSVWWVP